MLCVSYKICTPYVSNSYKSQDEMRAFIQQLLLVGEIFRLFFAWAFIEVNISDAIQFLTGNLTGTPTHFSRQSRTLVNKTPLQEPLGGRPRTAMDSRCRIPPSACPSIFFEPYHNSSKATSGSSLFVLETFLALTAI